MILLRHKKISGLFILFSIIYLLQSLLTKPDKTSLEKYHLTVAHAHELGLTIAIPYLIIWFIALIGYLRLRDYTESIKDSKDGAAFATISIGVLWLALWLPLSAVIAGFTTHIYNLHPGATASMVWLNNYLNIVLLFPAFVIIHSGSKKLLSLIKVVRQPSFQKTTLVFIGLSALYLLLVLHDPARQVPTHSAPVASYYQPDWLLVLTVIIPRLIMWFLGIQAMQNIYLYRKRIKGSIYQSALNNLARGIGSVVVAVVVLRSLQSLSSMLGRASLGLLLLIIYMLLIVIAIGYVFIANGAKKLKRIEEL